MYEERAVVNCEEVRALLQSVGLKMPAKTDYIVGIYDSSKLIGTGSLSGSTIQGVGIDIEYQGEGLLAKIITNLMKKAAENGIEVLHIFTKPEEACHFEGLGFKKIAESKPYTTLLEWGRNDIGPYKARLTELSENNPEDASCVVVNCNPFTLGHRHLIETAARQSSWLYILVVEEDASLFPFEVRLKLVQKGTRDIKNVTVIPGSKYVISSLTFPSYFIREGDVETAQVSLDLEIFVKHIAPALKIKRRYIGEEPYCSVTRFYNESMKNILPGKGIEVIEIKRLELYGGAISASAVRELIRSDRMEKIREMVPESTYQYLVSEEAKEVIEKIKKTRSRH